ncbi:MAG TPA: porin family protein [Bradyrhizobium sp.]|nr:porin family protein [Bradyrhizobium sp.]
MKTFLLATAATAAALAAFGATAQAADLGSRGYYQKAPAPVYAAPLYNWTGFYLGGHLGGAFSGNNSFNGLALSNSDARFMGGVQAGYNFQNGSPWVFGIEADIQGTTADDRFAPWKFSNPWFGTVRGRAGYAVNNVLFYATGGLAFGELRGETFGVSETHTNAGFTVGAGAEMGFAPNWSAKIEYLYVDLANSNFTITGGASNGYSFSLVRAGINYHF